MASPASLAGQIGFKTETTYGTAPTVDLFHPGLLDESIQQQIERINSRGIRAGRRTNHAWVAGAKTVSGGINVELWDEPAATLLNHMFGTIATTGAGPFCMDEDTEILTDTGWRRYDQIEPGSVVRTLNHETGLAEWQPVESVHVFPAESRELVLMKTRDHSSLSTPNHRWPVESFRHRKGERVRIWKTTETLAAADSIIKGAPSADQPTDQKWTDEFVELVAWHYTEGTIRESGSIRLCQSHEVNGDMCDRIEGVLRRSFGAPSDSLAHQYRDDQPRWRRYDEDRNARFSLNKAASDLVHAVCSDKVPSLGWIRELTVAQLELFIRVSLMADGDGTFDTIRTPRMAQVDDRRSEAFQFALILAGYGTSIRPNNQGQTVVSAHRGTRVGPLAASRKEGDQSTVERVQHDGIVWCPKTPNGSWLARREGTVYYTGNTHTASPGDLSTKSFAVEFGRPDDGGTVRSFVYAGCKIGSWDLSCAVGEIPTLSLDVSAQSETTGGALASASYPTAAPFVFVQGSVDTAGAENTTVRSVNLAADNNLATDRHRLGSDQINQQRENGVRSFTGTIEADFEDLTEYQRFVDGSELALVLAFDNATDSLTITMNVRYDGQTPTLPNDGRLTQTLPFFVTSGTSDAAAIQAILINNEASST